MHWALGADMIICQVSKTLPILLIQKRNAIGSIGFSPVLPIHSPLRNQILHFLDQCAKRTSNDDPRALQELLYPGSDIHIIVCSFLALQNCCRYDTAFISEFFDVIHTQDSMLCQFFRNPLKKPVVTCQDLLGLFIILPG